MTASAQSIERELQDTVRLANTSNKPLCIQGGNTKHFYGGEVSGTPILTRGHCGVLSYEPSELVITARSGTLLSDIEKLLDGKNQMLAFEPPGFGKHATIGGTIACGLSGPRRPYAGAARDFVLGTRIINGKGEVQTFGGQVMKNVAGYDVSRLMVGALGTLGLILEVSIKVLPRPVAEQTLVQECSAQQALQFCNEWTNQGLPLSAACFYNDRLHVRLSGAQSTLDKIHKRLGGEILEDAKTFWKQLKEHQHPFLSGEELLWRLSVPPAAPMMALQGEWLLDWGGAQRWLRTDAPAEIIRKEAGAVGGHGQQFRGGKRNNHVFHPLTKGVSALHSRLKNAFDPGKIFNVGRLQPDVEFEPDCTLN